MKVELQCGDSITIPEGCKAIVKDGSVVFEREEKEEERGFKDGDVLRSVYDHEVLIFKKNTCSEYFSSHYNYSGKDNNMWLIDAFRHATEEEKQLLFDKMKEQGLQWNAEEKKVEKTRWRAEVGEGYFYIGTGIQVCKLHENNDVYDNTFYDAFNYFRTEEQVEEAVKRVKETLRKYHEELGE